ncbi:asparagine synthase (glutamine-hydrolyzing) [Rhodocyclaceae bacterium]|nr:asparagine synthase (glutamine-hydrolyzing) [Rhodocyclaceae bacterium]
MCGIAGYFCKNQTPDTDELWRMANALRHRGPDDAGVHVSGPVGLAHTRLSIIDLQGGHQPLADTAGKLTLVANGEIYNYPELTATLTRQGRRFQTASDSETILHAYAVYRRDFLQHLHGMFAFALYDATQNQLILARDRLGIKPLYYVELPDRVAFASEIKALLPILPHAPQIHEGALAQFLENQFSSGEETCVRGIRRVLPGEALAIDADLRIQRWRYWSALTVRPRRIGFEDAAAEFDTLMEQVMREHMRADVPYGLFLSGGVDSAVLAAMLHRYQDQPIRSFSIGYRGVRQADELDDAARIAQRFGTEHTALEVDGNAILRRIPHMVWAADELMRDYACLPTSLLAQHASRELKVVLTGEGGDEVFAGYGRYRESPIARFFKQLRAPGTGGFRTRGQWQARHRDALGTQLKLQRRTARTPFIGAWRDTPADWSHTQRCQYTDLVTALPDNLLLKADRMLMAFGLEGRVPFVDHRIVEFGLSLPDELKIRSGQGKLFLKRWAERHLPADHLYRPKRGFHVPIGEWLRGPVLDALAEKLPASPAIQTWFNLAGVRRLLADQRAGRSASREIMCLLQFAIWHRLFIEHPGLRPTPDEDPLAWIG